MTRSAMPRWPLPQLAMRVAGAAAVLWLLCGHRFWMELALTLLASVVLEGWIMAPVARRWLQEHADELGRYVPE